MESEKNGLPPSKKLKVGSSTFTIAPDAGCRLMQWSVKSAAGNRDVLYWPGKVDDAAFHRIRGGNPILFPFCGRSFHAGLIGYWEAPGKGRLPMPMHGFARQSSFKVTSESPEHVEALLIPDAEAQAYYPFAYQFSVRYDFEELAFTVTLSLENHDNSPIPWSAGHHFYFTLPWHNAASRKDYLLHLESRKCGFQTPEGTLIASRDRNKQHNLGDPALQDRIHWELRHQQVAFGPKSGEEDVFLTIGDTDPPPSSTTLVTWSESPTAPFYCIEPWMGPPNAAELGKGLHWVSPGEKGLFKVKVSLY